MTQQTSNLAQQTCMRAPEPNIRRRSCTIIHCKAHVWQHGQKDRRQCANLFGPNMLTCAACVKRIGPRGRPNAEEWHSIKAALQRAAESALEKLVLHTKRLPALYDSASYVEARHCNNQGRPPSDKPVGSFYLLLCLPLVMLTWLGLGES